MPSHIMPVHRFVYSNHWPVHMTVAQYERACELAHEHGLPHTVEVPECMGDDESVMLDVGTHFVWVRPDGSSY